MNQNYIGDDGIEYTTITETEEFNQLNSGFHLYYKQDKMFEEKGNNKFVYGYDVTGPWDEKKQKNSTVKRYGFETDLNTFIQKYNNFEYGDIKFFYEMIQTNEARFEYYDCDIELPSTAIYASINPQYFIQYFEKIRNRFIGNNEYLKQFYNSKPEWRITDASNQYKMSLHIININNVFVDFEENKKFSDLFIDYIDTFEPEYKGIFDVSVYSRNRLFRCISSTKKGQQRPFKKASWHQPSLSSNINDFFVNNVDAKKVKISKKNFEKLNRTERKTQALEQKQEKKIEKFTSTFEMMETIDEGEDDTELLCNLIADTVKNQSSSICDSEFKNKINYNNLMKLSFAYINSVKDKNDSKSFWETDIYNNLYRHHEDHNINAIWNCFINSKHNNTNKYTKASLHYWAKEHTDYKKLFKKKEKNYSDDEIGKFDINDKKYYWNDFFRQITMLPYWDSLSQLQDFFIKNFPRVSNTVLSGTEQFYLKIDEHNNYQYNKRIDLGTIFIMNEDIPVPLRFTNLYNDSRRFFNRYQDIQFQPYDIYDDKICEQSKVINTFNGFQAHLIHDYDIPSFTNFEGYDEILPIINHIREVWANNDLDDFKYIISWLAYIVKIPHKLNKTMITLISDNEQVGKGIIVEWILREIIGLSNSGKTGEFENITGRFNSFIMNKIMIALDEMNDNEAYKNGSFNKFKTYITDEIQTVEIKGIDEKIRIKNHVNYICMTNQAGAIKISTGDKRIAVFNCSDKYSGNRNYFNQLYQCLQNNKSPDLFFTFLYNLPIDILIDPRDIPNNQAKRDMAKITMEQPRKFLCEIKNGEYEIGKSKRIILYDEEETKGDIKQYYTLEELYDEFTLWTYKSGERTGRYSSTKFRASIRSSIQKIRLRIDETGQRTGKKNFNPVERYDIETIDVK
jgi:hypothetical protein